MRSVALFIVRPDGAVDRIGEWNNASKTLRLERLGYPFLPLGEHREESDLPWLFEEMCPQGYMGRLFARRFSELGLGPNPALWSTEERLIALSRRGEDLPGNLIVGEESLDRFHALEKRRQEGTLWDDDFHSLTQAIQAPLQLENTSSVGGERPKVNLRGSHGQTLTKFSPPLETSMGQRWGDLLVAESLCLDILQQQGLRSNRPIAEGGFSLHARTAANAFILRHSGESSRVFLNVVRFDRVPAGGRIGAATLATLAATRSVNDPLATLQALFREGLVSQHDVDRCHQAKDFSSAIGHTDWHPGNVGLVFDTEGRASLAPQYDVLPMVFAPRHDELPDAYISEPPPTSPSVTALVSSLVSRVKSSSEFSDHFKRLWLKYPGSSE